MYFIYCTFVALGAHTWFFEICDLLIPNMLDFIYLFQIHINVYLWTSTLQWFVHVELDCSLQNICYEMELLFS